MMKNNRYLNEPQVQRWREKQDNEDSQYHNDRARRREKKRQLKTFGTQVKMLIDPVWWDSFEEHEQEDIHSKFYSERSSHYYNSRQALDLGTWLNKIYKTTKPNKSIYRGNKLNEVLSDEKI
jgi:hypothetical protein